MTTSDDDHNERFAQLKAAHDTQRAIRLAQAKVDAQRLDKEPFDEARFRELYQQVNADEIDQYTPWDTIIRESEYEYYVTFTEKMTMLDFIKYMRYLDGWG